MSNTAEIVSEVIRPLFSVFSLTTVVEYKSVSCGVLNRGLKSMVEVVLGFCKSLVF